MTFPWGKRRNTNGQADTTDSLTGLTTDRGYTEHEHLDEMGLIHMNGRVYDPLVGRMMSADPFIQAPGSLQSYNRYAYVMNNPLNLTDPSGYFSLRGFLRKLDTFVRNPSTSNAYNVHRSMPGVVAVDNFVVKNPWAYALGRAAAGFWGGPWAAAGASAYYAYITTGSDSSAIKAFGLSIGTSYAFEWAGDVGEGGKYGAGHYAAHAAVGCASSVAGGGKCGAGALSAMAGLAGTQFGSIAGGTTAGRFAYAAVAGGVASKLAGGSFIDGAQTAAYGFLFNECAHTRACGSDSTKVTVSANRVLGNMAHSEIQISSGYDFVVLEGQPGYSNGNNRLEGRSNGANQGDAFAIGLNPSDGRTMAQFALDLQTAGASYKDNLTYSFPSIRYSFSNLNGGYNSNGYVGGVLDAAAPGAGLRYVVQGAASRSGFRVPGMENPIPLSPVR